MHASRTRTLISALSAPFEGTADTTVLLLLGVATAALVSRDHVPLSLRRLAMPLTGVLVVLLLLLRLGNDLLALREGPLQIWDNSILAAAGAWMHGEPLYPAPEDGLFYGLLYGPLLYEILALAQRIFGIGSPLAALPGMIAEALAIAVTWNTARRLGIAPIPAALTAVAMLAWLCCYYDYNGMRGDAFLLLLGACALASLPALERGSRTAALLLGLCTGLAVTIKFTALVYTMPALLSVLLRRREWLLHLLFPTIMGGLLGLAGPYMAPGAGPSAHVTFLAALHPFALLRHMLVRNALFLCALTMPALLYRPGLTGARATSLFAGTGLCVLPIIYVAAVEGTDIWHFLPFLPATSVMLGLSIAASPVLDRRGMAFLAILWVGVLAGIASQACYIARTIALAPEREATHQAVAAFVAAHPQARIAIGPSTADPSRPWEEPAEAQTPWMVGTGQFLSFTLMGWLDMRSAPHADRFIARQLAPCAADYWVVRPGEPFARAGIDPRIAAAFQKYYRRVEHTRYLDVWACRRLQRP